MSRKDSASNVIDMARVMEERNSRPMPPSGAAATPAVQVVAITSGKGGVGKTNIVANLGLALSRIGKRVLILDADCGLGNLDVLLGLAPRYNLSHVVAGQRRLNEIVVDGPGDMKILPASSGILELTQLTIDQKLDILSQLDVLTAATDILLIDTAAGISSNVMDFSLMAQEILVVVSPEPTSLTDAYALIKILSIRYAERHCKLLVNLAGSYQEAKEIHRQLDLVVRKFLDFSIEYIGCVLYDDWVPRSVRRQKVVSELYPSSKAARCFTALAKKIDVLPVSRRPGSNSNFKWDHFQGNPVL
jgi:flagellar biosynthesis protein FlhG